MTLPGQIYAPDRRLNLAAFTTRQGEKRFGRKCLYQSQRQIHRSDHSQISRVVPERTNDGFRSESQYPRVVVSRCFAGSGLWATNELEKANEDLKSAQAELQRRWQNLAEAQKLSHSGTFGWTVSSGELVWSDETYRILGFTRETNPTLDLVFDRVHPEDRAGLQEIRDRATQSGIDLNVEHRLVTPEGVIKHVHAVAHAWKG